MARDIEPPTHAAEKNGALAPFSSLPFLVLWSATLISNIGTWMQNAGAGWLMATLTQDPFVIALVQVATMLPVVLLGLPAGVLADILDRRKLLILVNTASVVIVTILAILVGRGALGVSGLIAFTALLGATAALITPAWQAIVPSLVAKGDLQAAVALNSVALNVSRAVGPALGGFFIGWFGLSSPFWWNAILTCAVVIALLWWRPATVSANTLPPERFWSAFQLGFRHAAHNPHLRATLVRALGFFVFASAYWALLPLIAREQIKAGPDLYGAMLAVIGVGAVAGAVALPQLNTRLGAGGLVAAGTVVTAAALALFSQATTAAVGLLSCLLAGLSWIAVLAPLNVSAQFALPAWIKGRGLAIYAIVQFGAMATGSALWGHVAKLTSVSASLMIAAAGILLTLAVMQRFKLQTGAKHDMAPSMHWPAPQLAIDLRDDQGPVQVAIEYTIDANDRVAFLDAIYALRRERLRDGAYGWAIHEDAAVPGRFVESFHIGSWMEHQRQHQRVARADRDLQARVHQFHKGEQPPAVRHLMAITSFNDTPTQE